MKLCIFLPSLELGGTERRMVLLAKQLKEKGHNVGICTLRETGVFVEQVKNAGIPLHTANKGGRYDLIRPFFWLMGYFKKQKYDVVLSCLPSANLYALTSKITSVKTPLIWGLASAELPMGDYGLWARISYFVQMLLSRLSNKVVVNSLAGKQSAVRKGYQADNILVIHNGVDTQKFSYSDKKAKAWRNKHGIPKSVKLIGMVGRLDPAKGQKVFLEACELAHQQNDEIWFAMVGGGEDDFAKKMLNEIHQHPLYQKHQKRLAYIEHEDDVIAAYSAFDVTTIPSKSESLPNALLEAMACGRLAVVTDVGDCKYVVSDHGKVCEVGDSKAIASAWLSVLNKKKSQQKAIQKYIENNFSIEKMTQQFEDLCESLLQASTNGELSE